MLSALSYSEGLNHASISVSYVLDVCCNLVILDANMDAFGFAHVSVQDFFEDKPKHSKDEINCIAFKTCLTILEFDSPSHSFPLFYRYATIFCLDHFVAVSFEAREDILQQLLRFLFDDSARTYFWRFIASREKLSKKRLYLKWRSYHKRLRAKIGAISSTPETPLFLACMYGIEEVLNKLEPNSDWNQSNNRGTPALFIAVISNQTRAVQFLLNQDSLEVERRDSRGKTALHLAVGSGHFEIVQLLLSHGGIDVNAKDKSGRTPSARVIEDDRTNMAKLLRAEAVIDINSSNDQGQAPFSRVTHSGQEDMVKSLVKQDKLQVNACDRKGCTPLILAIVSGRSDIVQLLVSIDQVDVNMLGDSGLSALAYAAGKGQAALVRSLLTRKDIIVNTWGTQWTPLMIAAYYGYNHIIQLLISIDHVDINAVRNNSCALSLAVYCGHTAVVESLLTRRDINVNFKDNYRMTALNLAAFYGHDEIAKTLLAEETIVIDTEDDSIGPLGWAAFRGQLSVFRLLLARGVVEVDNWEYEFLLDLAREGGHQAIVKELNEHWLEAGK